VGPKKPTRVAAPLPRAKPRTAYGMPAHGSASAAGLRSAMKLRVYGYTGGCKLFFLLQEHSKHLREIVITPKASTSIYN